MSWKSIPSLPILDLASARLELHHAVQIPAILARSFLGKHHEDVHANLGWEEKLNALVARPIPTPSGELTIGVVLEKLELILLKEDKAHRFSFKGQSWDLAWRWMKEQLPAFGLDPSKIDMEQPYGHDLPDFPTQKGANFEFAKPEAYNYFGAFYSNTQDILGEILEGLPEASEIRCWPHHFDIASLLDLGEGKSIGVGMSPGDGTSPEPYFYITPWPYPDTSKVELPHLSAGKWHTEGWVGTVLGASEILASQDQEKLVKSFIKEAIKKGKALLAK